MAGREDPVTGLLPAFITKDGIPGGQFQGHAWIRDNVYCALSIWAMALSFRGHGEGEEDKQAAKELEKNAVRLMRSLLLCMLGQADKVEAFKKTLNKDYALHAKFNMSTCASVVGDYEWGHLQIDATSLFLLILAQMTASGIQIVYNLDEVDFIQNLIFYIETAYRTPDYGIWERGDKTNHGQTELNSTSIGMAKEGLVNIGEIDPLNRRLCTLPKPEPLVQVVLLAEDRELHSQLKNNGISTQTLNSFGQARAHGEMVTVLPAKLLGEAYQYLGRNSKMGLTGRYKKIIGVLSTSMLYSLHGKLYAFYPSFLDQETFYLSLDNELLVDVISTDLSYLKANWKLMGCPLLILPILWSMLGQEDSWDSSPVFKLLRNINSGYMNGVRLHLGNFSDFLSTCCEINMTFLENVQSSIWSRNVLTPRRSTVSILPADDTELERPRTYSDSSPIGGVVKKSRATPAGEKKQEMSISLSPSLRHLVVAKGWSTRRQSYSGGRFLRSSRESPKPEERRERSLMATLALEDLIHELETSTNVFDQTDILHLLHDNYGKDYEITISGTPCTIVTDLLVRQKTISVGQPNNEIHITQPLPQYELLDLIFRACGKDHSAVALTQEILVYLAMFIRSEPGLFDEMLRLRIGLIQNVMVIELARSLNCSNEDAVDQLLLLGPFELKNLLYHLLSRKEFTVDQSFGSGKATVSTDKAVRQLSIVTPNKVHRSGKLKEQVKALETGMSEEEGDKLGQWRRRRRIDGALNRVPPDFYTQVWHCLEKCDGLFIGNQILPKFPTIHEMTAGELKFALKVESVLNSLPDPEYRQLVVEVLMLTALINPERPLPQIVNVDDVIRTANFLFVVDQKECNGLASQCCGQMRGSCGAYWSICSHFYDSAPSGVYGTMSYLSRALLQTIQQNLPRDYSCKIS
uniref:Phosphorylase b kinase regulatory subunit n=1 Tax=Amphimedon queenslandica TaxID=400682 RepID=A0A1X7VMW5_AMPQE